jgi:hypothetical protein
MEWGMSNTFTIEEITKALKNASAPSERTKAKLWSTICVEDAIAELTRKEWKPEVGQFIVNRANHDKFWRVGSTDHRVFTDWREMNLTEHGPKVRNLIEGLKRLTDGNNGKFVADFAAKLLADNEIPE